MEGRSRHCLQLHLEGHTESAALDPSLPWTMNTGCCKGPLSHFDRSYIFEQAQHSLADDIFALAGVALQRHQ